MANVPVLIEDLVSKMFDKNVSFGIRENYRNQLKDIVSYCSKALDKQEQASRFPSK